MYKSWEYQDDNVKVSGNYLEHTKSGCSQTNAEKYNEDPYKGRTDFLLNNGDGTHAHISVDEYGNFDDRGDNHSHNKW